MYILFAIAIFSAVFIFPWTVGRLISGSDEYMIDNWILGVTAVTAALSVYIVVGGLYLGFSALFST